MAKEPVDTQSPEAGYFAEKAAKLLIDRHCENVLLLDVEGLSQVSDFVLIGTGTSDRQMKSIAGELANFGKNVGLSAFRTSIDSGATWIVIDFVTVIVHIFEPQRRSYYDLEDLWSDARRIDVKANTPTP
ncbi:MAG: ribosome silencing factor [Planctomycetota bacterium]|nr:ribosome silencing factor [Planctomycetota bacterium]